MSSLNATGALRLACLLLVALGLSGCFRPLNGPTATGKDMQGLLASIDVEEVKVPDNLGRLAHYIRSELVFDLDGSGIPAPKKYKLILGYSQYLSTPIVDSISGRALSATLNGTLDYILVALPSGPEVARGKVYSAASYDRYEQRFASVRAARDAEIRVAKDMSQQVRTAIAAALSQR